MCVLPLHCLVLLHVDRAVEFAGHECLSTTMIAQQLVGHERRLELSQIVFTELRHRLGLKLSLGERVVVLCEHLSDANKQQLIALAIDQGASVISVGERLAQAVYYPRNEPFEIVSASYSLDDLRQRFSGITVIGDIHGNLTELNTAIGWAKSRHHFAWLLGDVIDYGADTLACAQMAYELVMQGKAALVLGNHERKIARWLDQKHARISDGNRVTTEALNRLNPMQRRQWIGRFRALLSHASLMTQFANVTFVHAAVHPTLWSSHPDQHAVEQYGLNGQGEMNGKFRRVHYWVDAVPKGQLVFVGHDMISPLPLVVTGAKGGQVVFLDTGCGKGGHLSTADLRFTEHGVKLECFNRL